MEISLEIGTKVPLCPVGALPMMTVNAWMARVLQSERCRLTDEWEFQCREETQTSAAGIVGSQMERPTCVIWIQSPRE